MRRPGVAVLAVVAALGSGTFVAMSPAVAAPVPLVSEVGGGASPFSHQTITFTPSGERIVTTNPVVVILPKHGSPGLNKNLVGSKLAGINVGIGRAHTKGNLFGTPFAQSTADAAGITIPGLDIGAVDTDCIWNAVGRSAHTSIVRANSTRVETVAPNTTRDLPGGLGRYILNEQYTNEVIVGDQRRQVIGVIGLDLFLYTNANRTERFIFAESSCDPLKLPALSGTQFFGG